MSSSISKDARRRAATTENKSKQPRPRTATVESESSSSQYASLGSPSGSGSTHKSHHQNFVLADPVAFSYLEEDTSTSVVERSRELKGYQCYVVEQWACSRKAPTIIIAAFTGDPSHSINVGIISVPSDEEAWSQRLRVYFKALAQHNTKRKDTPLGALMVTNLSGFPSSLTILPIPDGDVRKHREDFFVNENLKRLGCAGRTAISLAPPSAPTQAKFHQLYKTSEKVGLYESVIELVRLCQIALVIFGVLESEYADGLLCDVTERSSSEWWAKFGLDLYGVEPIDGVLGPTTVAALLGTLIGARNRLHAYGTPVQKDVFDMDSTKHATASFQKSQRLHGVRKRRLDRKTLNRLHEVTSKQAAHESWAVPRAVKSTVAEFSGKGGEMVMDMVRGKDKATLAEMETTDIDRFTQLVGGERAKWLWLGKPLKRGPKEALTENPIDTTVRGRGNEDAEYQGPPMPYNDAEKLEPKEKPKHHRFRKKAATDPMEDREDEPHDGKDKRTVFGRATGRLKGRTKSHANVRSRSKELDQTSPYDERHDPSAHTSDGEPPSSGTASPSKRGSFEKAEHVDPKSAGHHLHPPHYTRQLTETPVESRSAFPPSPSYSDDEEIIPAYPSYLDQQMSKEVLNQHNIANDLACETEISDGEFPEDTRPGQKVGLLLRPTRSFNKYETDSYEGRHEKFWPRQLSFSAAEGTVLRWDPVDDFAALNERQQGSDTEEEVGPSEHMDPKKDLVREMLLAADARRYRGMVAQIGATAGTWVTSEVAAVEHLDEIAAEDLKQLTALCDPKSKRKDELARDAKAAFTEERGQLEETAKDVAGLGAKLDYELGALRSKVEDVGDAVAEFEKQVEYTEDRVDDLVKGSEKEGWWEWGIRMVTRMDKRSTAQVAEESKSQQGPG